MNATTLRITGATTSKSYDTCQWEAVVPPITLTKQQFGSTAAGKKPGANYQGYLGYVARHRAAKLAAPPADPLAQTGQHSIDSVVNQYAGMYGTPQNDPQIQASAQSQIDPIIAAITKKVNDQASTATGAISANSQALAKALGGVDYGAPYAQAKTEQASVDAALQQSLSGAGGTGLANDLSSRLAQIGDPAVAAAAGGIADRGAAIGGTQVAQGSSNLGSLIASAAAAKEYGQKMPGIAQLSGLQDIAGVNRQAVTDIGDQTAQVTSQLPQIVQALRVEAQNTRSNKAQAAAQLYEALTGQNITKATASAGLATDYAKLGQTAAYDNASLGIRQQTADAATTRAQAAAKKATAAKQPKALTPTDKKRLAGVATDLRYGVPPKQQFNSKTQAWMDVPGTGTPNSSYGEAYDQLIAEGAPPAYARAQVDRLYKPGEFGRPLTAAQKAKKKGQAAAAAAVANGTYGPQLPTGGH